MSKYVKVKSSLVTTYALSKAKPFVLPPASSKCYTAHYTTIPGSPHISVLIHLLRTKGVMSVLPHLVGHSIAYRGLGYGTISTIMATTTTGIIYCSHSIPHIPYHYTIGSSRVITTTALYKMLTSGTYTLV